MPRRSATPAGLSVAREKAFIACRAAGVYTLGQQAMLGTVPDRPLQAHGRARGGGIGLSAKRIEDAIGPCAATRCFEAALASGKLSHAYLLVGRDDGAKLALATALAKAGNCTGEHLPGQYCDVCASCRQIQAGGSPNMRVFGDGAKLDIEAVDQFIAYACIKTAPGSLRVSVFRGVDFFTDVAADRVLKTIEEPIAGNVFLLLSRNSRRVLPTIRSRVQVVKVQANVGADAVQAGGQQQDEDAALDVLLNYAKANLSLGDASSRLLRMDASATQRENAMEALRSIAVFMEGVLRARGKLPPLAHVSLDIEPELARVNFVLDESRVIPFLDRLGDRLQHVEQNVNAELVVTNALLELRRMTTDE